MQQNKLIIVSLLVFLLTGLSTSSFFLNEYLAKKITKNEHSATQLNFALEQENLTALSFAWKKTSIHSEQWLKLAKTLAKTQGEAAYQLALYYQNNYQDRPEQAIFWFKAAIRLNFHKASIALAQFYFQQENFAKASQVLAALPVDIVEGLNIKSQALKAEISINQGQIEQVSEIINKYAIPLKKIAEGQLLLKDIKKYQVLLSENQTEKSNSLAILCDNSIQLFATNLNNLKHLESLILDFKAQELNKSVCFSPVRYMPINALNCSFEQDKAIRCDEKNWQSWANTINTRYVGIMLPKGGANVHLGGLYFDVQDSVDVVAHEISHLLGFVDEYPLVAEHVKCRAIQNHIFSQNISVLQKYYQGEQRDIRSKVLKQVAWATHIKNTTPILHLVSKLDNKQYWQLGTPKEYKDEVGVFNAQTCDNSPEHLSAGFSAFKPVSQRTKLQYFALSFPTLYSALLQENSTQYLMPSFHYNIALAYFQQRSLEQANYWLKQAENWESNIDRRKKIRQGGF